ncbi:MAG: biotin/lipoyl-containing protein [Halanaerobium sp.]
MKKFRVEVDGEEYIVNIEEISSEGEIRSSSKVESSPQVQKKAAPVKQKKTESVPKQKTESEMAPPPDVGKGDILAPMPGNILEINVKRGEKVEKGDTLIILEAMKMENEISASQAGTVKEVKVRVGDSVDAEDVLLLME